ncbi:MAG: iron-sulfur cluster assembly accessory protein [Candidatus Aenigmarchaeota archaeon]|nr:iron-sulfur cluster assembly accessory protein [Candidatus Aenigmarchaeota archaeon]
METHSSSHGQANTQASNIITKDMIIAEVVAEYPEAADIFESFGLHCVGCSANTSDTVEAGALSHGMEDSQIEEMMSELNSKLSNVHHEARPENEHTELILTEKAISKLKDLMTAQGNGFIGVRVSAVPGGCSGYMYGMDFEKEQKEGDTVQEFPGLKVFTDSKSIKMLGGMTVDYVDALTGSGFKFINPNARGGCGCGKSFR